MIRRRLKSAQFLLSVAVFLVPLAAFSLAGYLRFATHLLPRYSADADARSYFGLLLLATVLWAIIAEHFGLTSVESYLPAELQAHRVLKACLITLVVVLATTFFYRDATFSRVFIWLCGLNLFLFALLVQVLFANLWLRRASRSKPGFQVLIVGVDDFALRVAHSLVSDCVTPCSIKGFIRLPGQTPAANDLQVYELSDIGQLAIGNGIDDVVIAVPPSFLGELPALRQELSRLCVPIRLVLNVGEALASRLEILRE